MQIQMLKNIFYRFQPKAVNFLKKKMLKNKLLVCGMALSQKKY